MSNAKALLSRVNKIKWYKTWFATISLVQKMLSDDYL